MINIFPPERGVRLQLTLPVLVIVAMTLSSCAWFSPPPASEPSAIAMVTRWGDNNLALIQTKGIMKLNMEVAGRNQSGRAAWAAKMPVSMRLEWLGATGQPLYSLAADGAYVAIRQAGESGVKRFKQNGATLERLIQIPIHIKDLIEILWGRPPLPEFSAARPKGTSDVIVLKSRWHRSIAELEPDNTGRIRKMTRFDRDGRLEYSILWNRWRSVDTYDLPTDITLLSHGGDRIDITIERVWPEAVIPPEAFSLDQP